MADTTVALTVTRTTPTFSASTGSGGTGTPQAAAACILHVTSLTPTNGDPVLRVGYRPGYDAEVSGLNTGWDVYANHEWGGEDWDTAAGSHVLLLFPDEQYPTVYAVATADGFTPVDVAGGGLVSVACGGVGDDSGWHQGVWTGWNYDNALTGGPDDGTAATFFAPIGVNASDVFVPEHGDLTTVLTALGTSMAGGFTSLGEQVTQINEEAIPGLVATDEATDTRLDTLEANELVVAEARGRHATDPVFAMCWPGEDLGHDDHAWSTPVPGNFSTGSWVRFDDLTVMPFTETDPGDPGEVVYSELFSQWHDGLGSWDNFEDAVQRKWDVDNQSWRSTLFFEWTPLLGPGLLLIATSATEGVYELPDGVPVTIVRHLEFNVSGNWRLRWYRRVWRETPTHTFDGADWVLIHTVNGTGTTSIDTYTAEPWTFGCGTGRVHVRKVTVRDVGPAGTLLAELDATDAAAANGAAFTDGAGNTVTPGAEAATFTPGSGSGVALGETSTTAYRGDRGKTAYDHSQVATGNPHGTTAADVGAAPTSRTITAGTGLTGGGDLSADRTLAVAYGLTASTAAEGIAIVRTHWRTGSYYGPTVPRVTNAGQTLASGEARAMPFYNPVSSRTIDQLAADIQAGSVGTGVLYVMADDGTGYPGAVLASATIPAPATTLTSSTRAPATVSGSTYVLPRGLLWLVAHGTGSTWSGLSLDGQSTLMPTPATYSTGGVSCWRVTGAGTTTFTSFPSGGSLSTGVLVLMRAA